MFVVVLLKNIKVIALVFFDVVKIARRYNSLNNEQNFILFLLCKVVLSKQ